MLEVLGQFSMIFTGFLKLFLIIFVFCLSAFLIIPAVIRTGSASTEQDDLSKFDSAWLYCFRHDFSC